jgi:hypothetical protein
MIAVAAPWRSDSASASALTPNIANAAVRHPISP